MSEATAGEQRPVIMSALAIMAMVNETVLPGLARDGIVPTMVWDPTVALMKRIDGSERADGIVAIDWALDQLTERGLIDPATRKPVAQAVVGVAVRAGAPKPDISSVDALIATLRATPSLVYSRAGASGIYFEKLIDQLGIGDEIRAKALVIPAGLTGQRVANGEVDLAIQQVSELMVVEGIDLVGPMPAEVQATTDFGAALFTGATQGAAAQRFIDALLTAEAKAKFEATGLVALF